MDKQKFTRGNGLLESSLAKLRARQSNRLIPDTLRSGRVLDIGCGSYPYFLSHTYFTEKYAIDNFQNSDVPENIQWFSLDINKNPVLPFEDGYFSAVTLLAVVEHLDPANLVTLFQECHRVVQPGGILILTTPSAWSDGLLRFMARLNLVSKEEINEHVYKYTLPLIGWYFGKGGFSMHKLHFGYFELGLNMWATAER